MSNAFEAGMGIHEEEWTAEVKEAVELIRKENGAEAGAGVYAFGKCKEYYSWFALITTSFFIILLAVMFTNFIFALTPDLRAMSTETKMKITLFAALIGIIYALAVIVQRAAVGYTYVVTASHLILYKGAGSKYNRWVTFNSESIVTKNGNRRALYVISPRNQSAARKAPVTRCVGECLTFAMSGISEEEEKRVTSAVKNAVENLRQGE